MLFSFVVLLSVYLCFIWFMFQSRKEILKIHTRQWKPRPSEDFLEELAEKCVGKTSTQAPHYSEELHSNQY